MTQNDKKILQQIDALIKRYGISSPFGWRTIWGQKQFHNGVDIPCPVGTEIVIPAGAQVKLFTDATHGGGRSAIALTAQFRYGFAHLAGVWNATTGETILITGNTGKTTGAHLHFTIWAGDWINPAEFVARHA